MIDGKMQDDATWKQCRVMVDLAEMLAAKDPELAEAYGFAAAMTGSCPREVLRVRVAREIVKRAGIPVTDYGFATTPQEAREIAARDRRAGRHQVAGPHRRADEGRRRAVRRHPRRGGGEGRARPRPGDQRPHAARRARRPQGRGQAGVLRGRRVGRHPQAAGDAVQRHGRHRHRGGRREPPRPRRPRALLEHPAAQRLPGQAGHRLRRASPAGAQPARADPHRARAAVRRARHDAGRDQPARRARGRLVRRPRRAHGHGERGRARARPLLDELGVGEEETRQAREATAFELAGEAVDAHGPPRRGGQRHRVRRRPRARHRRRRRLADALRRRARPRRQARQLLRDRRQPQRRARRAGWPSSCSRSPAWTRSR